MNRELYNFIMNLFKLLEVAETDLSYEVNNTGTIDVEFENGKYMSLSLGISYFNLYVAGRVDLWEENLLYNQESIDILTKAIKEIT